MRISNNQFNINFLNEFPPTNELTCGEFFAGGGGWTSGLEDVPGVKTLWILNHDKIALATNSYHHKTAQVFWADIYVQDEHELPYVDYVHASIECTQHSNANGGKDKKMGSYTMGWELVRYLKYLQPLVISIENVPEFKKWGPIDPVTGKPDKKRQGEEFERWKAEIMDMGYEYVETIRNAADDGLPTRRVRFFCFFYRKGINITIPEFTHAKVATKGKLRHSACRPFIKTEKHGVSIFGRQFNEDLPKSKRKPLVPNSLKRIAGGMRKYAPQLNQFLTNYYGGTDFNRFSSLLSPINTIPTENRHQLVTMEKIAFIMDHCRTDNYNTLEQPLNPQLTWQTKQLANVDVPAFIMDHCHSDKLQTLDEPLQTQTTRQTKQAVTIEDLSEFICSYYGGSNVIAPLNGPLNTCTVNDRHQYVRLEKVQFLATYYNSNGSPERNVKSLDEPLDSVMTELKHQLITILDEFDIKVRFLDAEELGGCSTFKPGYFTDPALKLSHKNAVRLIGNAVPPEWAKVLVGPNIQSIKSHKLRMEAA